MRVNICGIQHEIIEMDDNFDLNYHFGQIDYKKNEIRINKTLTNEGKKEAICHEMIHGIFVHLGYNDHANNEQLVQALGNAIYQGFEIKKDYPAAEYLKFMEEQAKYLKFPEEHKNEH